MNENKYGNVNVDIAGTSKRHISPVVTINFVGNVCILERFLFD